MSKTILELANEKSAQLKKEYEEKASIHTLLRYNVMMEDIKISIKQLNEQESKKETARFDTKTNELLGISKTGKETLDKINTYETKITTAYNKAVTDNTFQSFEELRNALDTDKPYEIFRQDSDARTILMEYEFSEDPMCAIHPWGFMEVGRRRTH